MTADQLTSLRSLYESAQLKLAKAPKGEKRKRERLMREIATMMLEAELGAVAR